MPQAPSTNGTGSRRGNTAPARDAAGLRPVDEPGRVHGLQVSAGEAVQRGRRRRRTRGSDIPDDVPGRAVVGEDHPVALERDAITLRLRRQAREIGRRLQADAQAHRRQAVLVEPA